jgi:hypothetical protein
MPLLKLQNILSALVMSKPNFSSSFLTKGQDTVFEGPNWRPEGGE